MIADSPGVSRILFLLVLLSMGFLYFWGLGSVGFQDPDEGMYAEIAREMLASGDWVIPRFNGVPYIEKPPLMYWLTAGTYAVLGPSEFSARLWKVIPMLATVLLTYALGRRLFIDEVGKLSAIILATTLGPFLFSRITQMDPLLVFGVTLSALGIVAAGRGTRGRSGESGGHAALCFWIGIGIGMMSKGLPGLVFPVMLLAVWTLIHRDMTAIRNVWSWAGLGVTVIFVVPWHVALVAKVPGFFQFYLLDNQLLRFLGERVYVEEGNSIGTLAFLGVTTYALFPWAPYLTAALAATMRGNWRDSRALFLMGWLLLVAGVFSISSFKLEYYALPAFPAVALLVAAFLSGAADTGKVETSPAPKSSGAAFGVLPLTFEGLPVWTWVALVGGAVYTAAVVWAWWAGYFTPQNIVRALSFWATNYRVMLEQGFPVPPVSPGYFKAVLLGGGMIWTGGFAAALFLARRRHVHGVTLAVALVGVCLSGSAASILQEVGAHHSLKPLAERLNGILRPDDVLVHERGLEKGGGLLFYTKRRALVLNGTQGDLEFGSRLAEHQGTFIDTTKLRSLWTSGKRVFLVTDLPESRSAISRVSPPPPIVLAATGTRWLYSNRAP